VKSSYAPYRVVATAPFFVLALSGCDGCQSEKPFTPFGAASAWPDAAVPAPPSASAPPAPSASAFTARAAERPPPGALSTWKVAGQTLEAPKGRQFAQGLSGDFGGDGKAEVVAWLVPAEKGPTVPLGELWLFPHEGAAELVAPLPGFVPTGPDCSLDVSLRQTGPRTVLLDASARCSSRLIPRAPVRALSIFQPGRPEAERLLMALKLAEAAPGERLDAEVETLDADGDGLDDVRVRMKVAAPEGRGTAEVPFVWFDRPQGPSRDPREPGTTFARLASRLVVESTGKNTSKKVDASALALYRLYASICEESGSTRFFAADTGGISCGELTTTFSRLRRARVQAALAQKDTLTALSVLEQNAWFEPAAKDAELSELRQVVRDAFTVLPIGRAEEAPVQPLAPGPLPRYSPLRFTSDGLLLVQSRDGVVAIGADGAPVDTDARAFDSWPVSIQSPSGRLFTGLILSCDRSEVALQITAPTGAREEPAAVSLLAPRPGPCAGGPGVSPPRLVPLGFHGDLPELFIAGTRVGGAPGSDESGEPAFGSARSPDGKTTVLPSSLGLVVRGAKQELWAGDLVDPPSLEGCAVANEARAVACVRRGSVVVFTRPDGR
jgi:hypothetical protein